MQIMIQPCIFITILIVVSKICCNDKYDQKHAMDICRFVQTEHNVLASSIDVPVCVMSDLG